MCGNLPSGSGKPEQTNSTNDRSSNTLNCQNKMGKTPGGRSRENSVDKKLLESKLSADGEELVDTTTQKEPHAPLLDRLAEMAEAEVHSIHRELGPALDRAELLQRKLITPSNSSQNIETKTSGEAITQSESQSETRSESRNGDAIDERQPHHAATSEPKRRPSSANRQPASTTPPPTWARQHGIPPPSYPYKHYPGHPAGFHPHHSHPHAYPQGPPTHFPPPQHRASPSTPLRGAPYPPIPPHPNHVQHHHYHHYHPPPPHFGPVPHHYEPRSHHGPPYSRHHQHAFPPHIPSHSSMPPPPNPSDDIIRTKQEDAAGSKSKKSDSIKKGLPPKKRKLRQETFDAKENEPDNLEKEEETESDLRKGTAALKITTPSCNNESDDSDGANNCEPLYKRIKNDGKNEFDQITDKRDGEDPTNETSKVNHDKRIAKKKKHEIVTPSPRGIGPDSKQSDTASALSKAVNPPSAEASEIGNSASFTSADSVPSNGNSIKTPTSSRGGSSNSMSSTPKLDDKQRKHSMQSHSAHPIYPRPSPSPHHHPHPPSWGYRGYPPPPHHGHPMSPYGKYPVGQHHPPRPIPPPHHPPPPRYYSPHPHGRQHHDGGPYWHPHPHTYHNPTHHLPHRPRSILPPHVGPTPIQRNPIPMENVSSADIAVDASKNSTEITRPTLTVKTEPSASKVIATGTPKSSQMSGNPDDDNASSGIQNKGKCVHIWGSMLMNFIG